MASLDGKTADQVIAEAKRIRVEREREQAEQIESATGFDLLVRLFVSSRMVLPLVSLVATSPKTSRLTVAPSFASSR